MAACLALASDAVACLPREECQGTHRGTPEVDAASQFARVDALQGIVHASALLAASAAELIAELCSRPDDPPEAGGKTPT